MVNDNQPTLRIYTAGAMRNDDRYATWRRSIGAEFDNMTFYHPEGFCTEHGGTSIGGAVSEDMAAIRAADGLIAYITETPQVGTIVELLHAVHTDTPTLVLFNYGGDDGLIEGMISKQEDYDDKRQELRYPVEVEPLDVMSFASDHWFLVNYLVGDSEPISLQPSQVEGSLPGAITQWGGIREATVIALPEEGKVPNAVLNWFEKVFGVEAASRST